MAGDDKITLHVGSVTRIGPARKAASGADTTRMAVAAPAAQAAPRQVPVARLIGFAGELAAQDAPVDMGRVAALRTAIADGSYAVDPDRIARSALRFYNGGAD